MKLTARLWQLAIWIDQGLNVLIGSGWADETLSAYAHRVGGRRRTWINRLFFWQDDHCLVAYQSERLRQHLPMEYRAK